MKSNSISSSLKLFQSSMTSLSLTGLSPLIGNINTSFVEVKDSYFENITTFDCLEHINSNNEFSLNIKFSSCTLQNNVNDFYGGVALGMVGGTDFKGTNLTIVKSKSTYREQQNSTGNQTYEDSEFVECTTRLNGGALAKIDYGSLNVTNCEFKKCEARGVTSQGGAIYIGTSVPLASLYTKDCKFIKCHAKKCGGAISATGILVATNPVVKSCTSVEGGGMYIHPSEVNVVPEGTLRGIDGGEITHCTATEDGGGLWIGLLTTFIRPKFNVSDVYIASCKAVGGMGGGVFLAETTSGLPLLFSDFYFVRCIFGENKAEYGGNDIFAEEGWKDALTESSFVESYSDSSTPKVQIESQGEFNDWLKKVPYLRWEYVVVVVVCIVVVILVVVLIIVLCCCRKKLKKCCCCCK
eukprot:MONOS_1545.1-p1 / transcript=MONOS_1545.1 / gene=MONOS_1545 / organism=Monocercomonoides_exilis_PA203 / gene_product=unspecified product / transcript_product=unspecified product / location=Mono_scaffold00027:194826-196055(+) / protein_length=410 / sequence_SO=supercontig / SO=protein_coding / is_pseudo=false